MQKLKFEKYEGLGNDFILVDLRSKPAMADEMIKKVNRLCDRRFGIGADGLILIFGDHQNDARVEIYNSDGSRPEMCGNGIRCVANYLASLNSNSKVSILTDAGVKTCQIVSDENSDDAEVLVDMGRAQFDLGSLPCLNDQIPSPSIKIKGFEVILVSMGNPHAVIFTDKNPNAMALEHGPTLEVDPCFPKRSNIEFAKQLGPNHFQVGVWERGCGITLACGTGACAVAAAAVKSGRIEFATEVKIDLPGGTLWIDVDRYEQAVFMRGPAKKVFTGELAF